MNTQPHPLASDPLAHMAFEKIRRVGATCADGQIIQYESVEHGLTVHRISTIETIHVVIKTLNGRAGDFQRAMAIIKVEDKGYVGGPGGLDLVLPALHLGVRVPGHLADGWEYSVLPWLPVPQLFCATDHDRQ